MGVDNAVLSNFGEGGGRVQLVQILLGFAILNTTRFGVIAVVRNINFGGAQEFGGNKGKTKIFQLAEILSNHRQQIKMKSTHELRVHDCQVLFPLATYFFVEGTHPVVGRCNAVPFSQVRIKTVFSQA